MSDTPSPADQSGDARTEEAGARVFHPIDTLLAVFVFGIVGLLWYASSQFEGVSSLFQDNIAPEKFPRILLVTIAFFALFLPFEHLLLKRDGRDIDKNRKTPVKRLAWVTMAALLAIVSAGYYLGTFLTMAKVCLIIPMLWGERKLIAVVPFAIGFPLLVAFIFEIFLRVPFDPGIFGISLR